MKSGPNSKLWFTLGFILISMVTFGQADTTRANSSSPNILDSLISVTIILFILSVIVEKITQLIRKYSPFIKPNSKLHKTRLRTFWRNINKSQKDHTDLDKKIEREVTSLSFILGLLIAV